MTLRVMIAWLLLSTMGTACFAVYPGGTLVVIDPGHGGKDPGARSGRSRGALVEKTIVLSIAREIAGALRSRGVEVVLTRTADKFVPLSQRAATANGLHAALFVSVHADSNPDRSQRGFSVLMPRMASPGAHNAARRISESMTAAGMHEHTVRRDNRGLLVLHRTRGPAVLVEVGFLSNKAEGSLLGQKGEQERIGRSIAEGIATYLGR